MIIIPESIKPAKPSFKRVALAMVVGLLAVLLMSTLSLAIQNSSSGIILSAQVIQVAP